MIALDVSGMQWYSLLRCTFFVGFKAIKVRMRLVLIGV
jgi:hypothetical protein